MSDGGKGSKQRPKQITQQQFEDSWNRIFAGHPVEDNPPFHNPNELHTIKEKDDTSTKPEGTTSNKKNLQQTQKRRRIVSRVVGRNSR